MANPVMNYNQFMSAFKKAESGYRGKANTVNNDKNGSAKIKQELAQGPVKGKGTPQIGKHTSKHLSNIKKKNAAGK
jgi:hypothetical protein